MRERPPARVAGAAELADAWRDIAVPMLTYLAAAEWGVPSDPRAAADWLLADGRIAFLHRFHDMPVIATLQRLRAANTGRLAILSPRGADIDEVGMLLDQVARLACADLGMRRLEWLVPRRWRRAAEAAEAVGFAEEACLSEAWFVDGRYEDLLLFGLLPEERRAP